MGSVVTFGIGSDNLEKSDLPGFRNVNVLGVDLNATVERRAENPQRLANRLDPLRRIVAKRLSQATRVSVRRLQARVQPVSIIA